MTGWGLGMTKGDDPFSVGAQHDVPREITRFPKGHVMPCPYGTYVEVDAPSGDVGPHAVPMREIQDLAGEPGKVLDCGQIALSGRVYSGIENGWRAESGNSMEPRRGLEPRTN